MAVLEMMPCRLCRLVTGETTVLENGDKVAGETESVFLCNCDAVPNGKADVITLADGTQTSYSYTLYIHTRHLPVLLEDLAYGDRVTVTIGGVDREFRVLGFHRYQLQCKIWV